MSWTTPRTFADGEVETGSIFNTYWRDNALHVYGEQEAFTPTVDQAGSITLTLAVGRYRHVGSVCWLHVFVDFGGTGTTANAVTTGSIPSAIAPRVSAAAISGTSDLDVGVGFYLDSGTAVYQCLCTFASSSTVHLYAMTGTLNSQVGVSPALAVAAADSMGFDFAYETSSASS